MVNQLKILRNRIEPLQQIDGTHNLIDKHKLSNSMAEQPQIIEFSLDDLAAIAGGNDESETGGDGHYLNHNETLVPPEKAVPSQQPKVTSLSRQELVAIVGGNGDGKPDDGYGGNGITLNHNETIVISKTVQLL
jgi:hypothetical protein